VVSPAYPVCQAKQPLAIFPRMWQIRGEPATAVYDYRCACGRHSRRGHTCESHIPADGEVGCSQCWDLGHECAMSVTAAVS